MERQNRISFIQRWVHLNNGEVIMNNTEDKVYLFEEITPKQVLTNEGIFTITKWNGALGYLTNEDNLIRHSEIIMEKQ